MNAYAILDTTARVLRVEHADEPPEAGEGEAVVALAEWSGWPAEPFAGAALAYRAGAWAWDDPRQLADVRAAQLAAMQAAYDQAVLTPIPFTTAAGVAQTYQSDPQSVGNATAAMLGCQATHAVPDGFAWIALDNTPVPFTYADLQGLSAAMFLQGNAMFARLQQRKAAVRAAATVSAAAAVAW